MTLQSNSQSLPCLSSVLAQTIGKAANWTTFFPTHEVASEAFVSLPSELQGYLVQRSSEHGIDAVEMLRKIPEKLWDYPDVMDKWLRLMDVSHIKSQSLYPHLADNPSNVIWEPLGDNRARQMADMTGEEFKEALDNGLETGRQLIEEITNTSPIWIELRELFHAFVQCAQALGYAMSWVPQKMFGSFMESIIRMLRKLRNANGWA